MSETPLNNTPEARTETGELKNLATPPEAIPVVTTTETPPPSTSEAKPAGEVKAGEVKPAAEAKAGEADPNKSLLNQEEPAAAAPEAYAEFKLPEGYTLDKATLEAATPLFKEMNLSQDQAQKLVDFYTKQQQSAVDKPYQDYLITRKGWQDQVKQDFGNQLNEVRSTIGRLLNGLDPAINKGFRDAMDLTGVGDNPAFVKAFYAIAKRATEGRPVNGSGPAPVTPPGTKPPTPAQALFPNLQSSSSTP